MLADLVHRIVYCRKGHTLPELVRASENAIIEMYHDEPYIAAFRSIIDRAAELASNDHDDETNIRALGEGWVAEETLAIAVYCALRYQNDFSDGIIAAVNHNGDSDSTGAVAGNILGAWLGIDAIDACWKDKLELYPVILEMADDLCGKEHDEAWQRKYTQTVRQEQTPVFFWHEYEAYGKFSNWYPASFTLDNCIYFHTEQYMMAQKAKLFHDD